MGEVRGKLRQLKPFQPFIRPKLQSSTENQDGSPPNHLAQMPQCLDITPSQFHGSSDVFCKDGQFPIYRVAQLNQRS